MDSEDAFQAASGFEGKTLLIFNIDKTQLDGTSSNVSYDLRVGSEYKSHRDAEKTELPDDGVLVLRPGNAVLIQSEEVLFVPRKLPEPYFPIYWLGEHAKPQIGCLG